MNWRKMLTYSEIDFVIINRFKGVKLFNNEKENAI